MIGLQNSGGVTPTTGAVASLARLNVDLVLKTNVFELRW